MNLSMKTPLLAALFGLGLLATPSLAHAGGLVIEARDLSPEESATLRKDAAHARASRPDITDHVRHVKGVTREVYSAARNPLPNAERELRALGKDAVVPMLEALALDASQPELSEKEREALTVGMLRAIGFARDPRALPVLRRILASRSSSDPVAIAAAGALGASCGESEVKLLVGLAKAGSSLEVAAVSGLGECRRVSAAKALASLLDAAGGERAVRLAEALGQLASSWAWAALGKDRAVEAAQVRTVAETALLGVFEREASARPAAKKALSKVAKDGTEARSSAERAKNRGDVSLSDELTALAKKLDAKRR